MSYREYFNIDPDYFPQVDKRIIETQPDLWKKFYPHPSFVKLLKSTVNVLKRKDKLSVWVNGAYGTGKSHAVLTLKKLLEASDEDTVAYFEKYELDDFLCKTLTTEKNAGKILVCHRYGSSDIVSDTELIVAIQEGIEKALAENGIENKANVSLKNSLIRYLENEENKQSFNIYAAGSCRDILGGDTADDILDKLKRYDDEALRTLITKLFDVPTVKGTFSMNTGELCSWIKEVIEKNNLYNLIFIWDEFSEYFENNMHHLTGFQQVAELSATVPFCLMIVTHKAEAYFSDSDPDKRKILDRFVSPISIDLPENIAFELMAQAMNITDDSDLAQKWEKNKDSLGRRTMQSRDIVRKKIRLTDKDLLNVLPIHPYAALLLQHISIYYTSTARSMFNFIKNDEGDEVKAFQWFIDNYDFNSQNPFVTIDMLWNFFYESGQDKLALGIKEVLDCYTPRMEKDLITNEKRVLKTILLLQAVSERMTGDRDIFLPNERNIDLAFEGTDLARTAKKIANKLLNDHVITRTPLTGDVFSYCCKNVGTTIDYKPFMDIAKAKTTKDMSLMTGSDLRNVVDLTGAINLRYNLSHATLSDFDSEVKKANNPSEESNKIYAIATIARDTTERATLQKKIKTFFEKNPESDVVVIDYSTTMLGESEYNAFVENFAMALAIGNSDLDQRRTYEKYATDTLKDWAKRIRNGESYVYSKYAVSGHHAANNSDMFSVLKEIDKYHYPKCLEATFTNVLNTMFDCNSLGKGASCGITQITSGTFKSSNEATKLENALSGVWQKENYWIDAAPSTPTARNIVDLKIAVDEIIENKYKNNDRIAISEIYNILKKEPYGFMPCNLTAFVLGFILKEYANSSYSYSDNLTTIPLTTENLSSMISDVIKLENTPDKRYKDKFIVTLTEEERSFNRATSDIFGIDERYCVSITDTRSRIREQMKNFYFPIWLISYTLDGVDFKTNKDIVCKLIDLYCGIANNGNIEGNKSDTDIALAIGRLCLDKPDVVDDFKKVLTKDNCKDGMLKYLEEYRTGLLPSLAKSIGDNGVYINHLRYKFSSDAANWVWNKDTVNSKIDELIVEYEIIENSNKILTKNVSYQDTINAWCSKMDQIRLAYSVIKNELGDSKEFFEMLYNLKKARNLLDSQKSRFLELLVLHIDDFKNFMTSQSEVFMKTCEFYLDDLTLDDVKAILDDDKYGFKTTYTLEPNLYIDKVQKSVEAYKNNLGWIKLRKIWKDLTNTDSPMDWSNKYEMPIKVMVPESEIATARRVFDIINSRTVIKSDIEEATSYITKMSYVDKLNDESERDKAFTENFLSQYAALFGDLHEVKQYLRKYITDSPYYWYENKEVKSRIGSMAKMKYNETGYAKAKRIIDDMPADQVKAYLKKMLEDDIAVGVKIIEGKS